MTQYLMSVYMTGDEVEMSEDEIQVVYRQVDAFNAELQAAGAWVFAGGLHAGDSATVVQAKDGEVLTTDGPFAETKEHLGGFWVIEAADLDAALAWAAKASGRVHGPGRGAPVPGRAEPEPAACPIGRLTIELGRIFRHESGRAIATLVRLFGDIDVAEEAVQEAFVVADAAVAGDRAAAEPRRLDHDDGPQPGDRPPAPRGHPAMTVTPRPRSLHDAATNRPNRWDPWTTTGCG